MVLRGQQLGPVVTHVPHCWMSGINSRACHTFVTLPCQYADSPAPSYLLPNRKCHVSEYHWWNLLKLYACALAAQKAGKEALNSNSSNIARVLKNKLGSKRT